MSVTKPDFPIGNHPKFQYLQGYYFPGEHPVVPQIACSGRGGDPSHARDFLSEAEDIFGSRKEFQSKDFLCSLPPWGCSAVLCRSESGSIGQNTLYICMCL